MFSNFLTLILSNFFPKLTHLYALSFWNLLNCFQTVTKPMKWCFNFYFQIKPKHWVLIDTLALLPSVKRQVFCEGDRLKMDKHKAWATTIVAPKSVGSLTTKGQMKPIYDMPHSFLYAVWVQLNLFCENIRIVEIFDKISDEKVDHW